MADNRPAPKPVESETAPKSVESEKKTDPEESMIVHRVNVVDPNTGEPKIVEHGPMPVSEWSAYEKKHNL